MSARASLAPIAPTDRVSDVLARDESLVEVFARAAPRFATLRSRAMRRVMARLVTVEQAARMAGVSSDALVHELNTALGVEATEGRTAGHVTGAAQGVVDRTPSAHAVPAWPEVELDVREDLRAGREPFSKIMAAVNALGEGEVLHLRATFAPVPLYTVMAKRGFAHEAIAHTPDDWSVRFWRPATAARTASETSIAPETFAAPDIFAAPGMSATAGTFTVPAGIDADPSPDTIWLDVRGLEPPEPLVRTLAALDVLPEGAELVQANVRVPQFLLPMLAERGFTCEIDDAHADHVLVRIWRPTHPPPAA